MKAFRVLRGLAGVALLMARFEAALGDVTCVNAVLRTENSSVDCVSTASPLDVSVSGSRFLPCESGEGGEVCAEICFSNEETKEVSIFASVAFGQNELFFSLFDLDSNQPFPLLPEQGDCESDPSLSFCALCSSSNTSAFHLVQGDSLTFNVSAFAKSVQNGLKSDSNEDRNTIILVVGATIVGACFGAIITRLLSTKKPKSEVEVVVRKDFSKKDIEALGKTKGRVKQEGKAAMLQKWNEKSQNTGNRNKKNVTLLSDRFGKLQMKGSSRLMSLRTEISAFTVENYKEKVTPTDKLRFEMYKTLTKSSARLNQLLFTSSNLQAKNINASLIDSIVDKVCVYIDDNLMADSELDVPAEEGGEHEKFDGDGTDMPIKFYLLRLIGGMDRWFCAEDSKKAEIVGVRCVILALAYISRIKQSDELFAVTTYNIHRLFAVLVLIGAKMTEDEMIVNRYWSDICGLELDELNSLENDVFFESGVNFNVTAAELARLTADLELEASINTSFRGMPAPSIATSLSRSPDPV